MRCSWCCCCAGPARSPRCSPTGGRALLLLGAAAVITVNWGGYIWGVNNGHVVETSLGYFINPLVTVLMGVAGARRAAAPAPVVRRRAGRGRRRRADRRLRPAAVDRAAAGVLVRAPTAWPRRRPDVGAVESLTVETLLHRAGRARRTSSGSALVRRLVVRQRGPRPRGAASPSTGIVTADPAALLRRRGDPGDDGDARAAAVPRPDPPVRARACCCSTRPMPAGRWIGFVLVWVALAVFTVEAATHRRRSAAAGRRGRPRSEPAPLRELSAVRGRHHVGELLERLRGPGRRAAPRAAPCASSARGDDVGAGLVDRGVRAQQGERLGVPVVVGEVAGEQLAAAARRPGRSEARAISTGRVGTPSRRSVPGVLPDSSESLGDVEDVVGQLERRADDLAVRRERLLDLAARAAEQGAEARRRGDQRAGLAGDDVEVVRQRVLAVGRAARSRGSGPRPAARTSAAWMRTASGPRSAMSSDDFANRKSPVRIATWLSQRALASRRPRRSAASSITSSW